MSYRAFKRLLGETSLERKCRFLFGAFILLLITVSFWFYASLTEGLALDQLDTTCRLLTGPILAQEFGPEHGHKDGSKGTAPQPASGRESPAPYKYRFITPDAVKPEHKHDDSYELELLKGFAADEQRQEDTRTLLVD